MTGGDVAYNKEEVYI